MAERIKGITVTIGGDTTGLDKALQEVNKTSRELQSELKDVTRLLKFDPNNAELLAQRQKLLNEQIENTSKKLEQLQEAEAEVQKQFEKGDIGADQYRAFQRELQDTQQFLRHTETQLAALQDEQADVEKGTRDLNKIFELTNSSLEEYADTLGGRLVRSIQNGTASSRDLRKAFDRVSRQALGSSTDIGEVRQALQRLESGETSVRNVRRELQRLSSDAQDARGAVKDLGGELGGMVAGAAAGMGAGAIIGKALDFENLDTKLDITLDVPDESKAAVKEAIKDVEAYGLDTQEAFEAARRQWALNGEAGDEANQKIIKSASAISAAYGNIDITELIQESHEMGKEMGITQEEALGMTNALLKMGFPPEQLDIMSEYGSQLSRAGYSAEEIQGIFSAGIETGTWNIDNLMDGLKEGRILMAEFGAEIPKALEDSLAGTDISAEQVKKWGQAVAEGGEEGKAAMMDVALQLSQIEDDTKRNELGAAMFGTMWEEQGKKITDTIIGAEEKTGDLAKNQEGLNEAVASMESNPQVMLNQALTDMATALAPLFEMIANVVAKVAEWMSENPTLAATIAAIVAVVGILIGIAAFLAPLFMAISGAAAAAGVGVMAFMSPVLIAIGIIAAIIAIGFLLVKNWDVIMEKAGQLGAWISKKFSELKEKAAAKLEETLESIKEIWGNVMEFFENIDLKQIGKDIIQGLINGIGSMATAVTDKAKEIASGIGDKIASILKLGSPSKLMIGMGEDTGEGLIIGLENTVNGLKNMSSKMAEASIPDVNLNQNVNGAAAGTAKDKSLVVNIHSPKALDAREANKQFNRTLNKMSLMW
jgi:phage-related minor tail protein